MSGQEDFDEFTFEKRLDTRTELATIGGISFKQYGSKVLEEINYLRSMWTQNLWRGTIQPGDVQL